VDFLQSFRGIRRVKFQRQLPQGPLIKRPKPQDKIITPIQTFLIEFHQSTFKLSLGILENPKVSSMIPNAKAKFVGEKVTLCKDVIIFDDLFPAAANQGHFR
jgi:hypothetical protein